MSGLSENSTEITERLNQRSDESERASDSCCVHEHPVIQTETHLLSVFVITEAESICAHIKLTPNLCPVLL